MKNIDILLFFLVSFLFINCQQRTPEDKITKLDHQNTTNNKEQGDKPIKYSDLPSTNSPEEISGNNFVFRNENILSDSTFDTNKNTVYLTFDDGPLEGTPNVIDICQNNNVTASFFIVGLHSTYSTYGKKTLEKLKNMAPKLEIFNHSYSHAYNRYNEYYQHPLRVVNDLKLCYDTLHLHTNICRLPGNNIWITPELKYFRPQYIRTVEAIDFAKFNVIGWDLEWDFTRECRPVQSVQEMLNMVDSSFRNEKRLKKRKNAVILMHDNMYRFPSDSIKLDIFIKGLKSRNYQFATISNYPHFRKKNIYY
ncbi:MAG: polysaccharide deacetylase family protein [Sediminibacterium sp.]|nr:polysaccharide deacetylase family protein [Sediminibacterium sp.]